MKQISLAVFFIFSSSTLTATEWPDYPSEVILSNKGDQVAGMHIDCQLGQDEASLSCDFMQMSVSYDLDPEDLQAKIAEDAQEIDALSNDEALKLAKDTCPTAEKEAGGGEDTESQRKLLGLVQRMCMVETANKARSLLKDIMAFTRELGTKTCVVWPNKWQQTFRLQVTAVGEDYWLSDVTPTGECGVILASTMKRHKDYSTLWEYDSKRIVTNKPGGVGSLIPCGEVEEPASSYGWRQKNFKRHCKTIEFGYPW